MKKIAVNTSGFLIACLSFCKIHKFEEFLASMQKQQDDFLHHLNIHRIKPYDFLASFRFDSCESVSDLDHKDFFKINSYI